MTNYVSTLVHLVPDAKFSYTGLDVAYEDIEWLDERPQPTKEFCESAWPAIGHELEYAKIKRERKIRYTAETDGLFFDAMRSGAELTEWIAAVEAIKAELPYPEQLAA
tara:strand:- start:46 stop:369 length:324 start_codon:yes stop_codon:yes gene_type:complete